MIGAFARLVALDLKLAWRGLGAAGGGRRAPLLVLGVALALHVVAWPVGLYLGARETPAFVREAIGAGALFVLPWAAASPMSALARLFWQRGDLDLMLASPMNLQAILAARLVALGLEGVSASALLLGPLADVCALQGRPHWLALYPVLFGAGLLGASLGSALALALVFALGPRRARVATQIVAAAIGGSAALTAQVIAFMPGGARSGLVAVFAGAPTAALSLPVRAAAGEPAALALWLTLALAAPVLAALTLAPAFARAAMLAAGAPAAATRSIRAPRFTASLPTALRRKEHRLLWRDPWLLSQMGLQTLYTLPIAFILWRNGGLTAQPGVAFAPALAVIAGQLSASLAWIALCGEEASDFVATAPATRGEVERAKLAAVAAPVALVMTPPLVGLAFASPGAAAIGLACGVGASVTGALAVLWRQAPARRGLVMRRHGQSKIAALIEHWLSLCWASAAGIAAFGSFAALAPVGLVALTLWRLKPSR